MSFLDDQFAEMVKERRRNPPTVGKSTPGPWRYEQAPILGAIDNCQIRTDADCNYPYVGTAYSEANARMIAAAPQLYEVLKDIVAVSGFHHLTGENLQKAWSAIQKAEGD